MTFRTKRPTIKQVALAAGVSTQTVSRVMNQRPDVSSETRQRVQDVIDQLGYQPSEVARSLIHQRTYTIGVVTAGLKYIGPSRTISGITQAAEEYGYALMVKELPRFNANNVEPILKEFVSRHVDGIIWAVPEVGENRAWVSKPPTYIEIPIVFLTMQPQDHLTVVSSDNYLGACLAVNHLIEQGYRHIGHISGPLDWWEARQRMAAWKDTLQAHQMPALDAHWVEGNWSSASAAQAIQTLFQQYPEMDAVFAANDQMALSVLQAACQAKLCVPENLGVVGFDNMAESAYFFPPLTTVNSDQESVGKIAVEELVKIIQSRRQERDAVVEPQIIILSPTLEIRRSSKHDNGLDPKEVILTEKAV